MGEQWAGVEQCPRLFGEGPGAPVYRRPPTSVTAHFTHLHPLPVSTRPVHRQGLLRTSEEVQENRWTTAARPGKGLAEHRGALTLNLERLHSYAEVSLGL